MYLDILKCISLIFMILVSCWVIFVLLILVGLVNKKLLIGFVLVLSLECDSNIVLLSVFIVLF